MIRKLEVRDVPQVAEIERLSFSEPWSEKALLESIYMPFAYFKVFEENGEVLGYAGLYAVAAEGNITNVAVHPDHQRRGIGRALVEEIIKEGEALRLDFISLEVRESNLGAISLYTKCGFKEVGVRKNFYKKPLENAVIMNYYFNEDK